MIEWLRSEALEPAIELGGRKIPIELRRHARAKRLTLRLAPDGKAVLITLPRWCASKEAIAFAHARAAWLQAQLDKVPETFDPVASRRLPYKGSELVIDWREDAPRRPTLEMDTLRLGGPEYTLGKRLQRFLETEAQSHFTDDAAFYCGRAALPVAPVRLTRARRRWGSCSSEGVLRLNWRLIMAPDFVRRSVVAHEVAHLVHFDHSEAFHALLDELYEDDIERANRWLSASGRKLYACFT
ncbi:M48 family metallopeptidase [Qipengyuania sp. GH38]|uniref:M48 family metallopeptidase n=1 Tax=Qipengyuania intermedia TaxID=2867244 RepID=UPI001C87EFD9|nr:M48 family metallopeptidase [Qipengyuania intermedia]